MFTINCDCYFTLGAIWLGASPSRNHFLSKNRETVKIKYQKLHIHFEVKREILKLVMYTVR